MNMAAYTSHSFPKKETGNTGKDCKQDTGRCRKRL